MKRFCTIAIAWLLPLLGYSGALDGVKLVAPEVTICKGTSVDLSKYVESTPPGTATAWSVGSNAVSEEQSPQVTTSYTATFTNGDETAQRTLRVNVIQPPVISAVSPTGEAANICKGGTVTLNATAGNYSEVRWYRQGSVTPIANGTTLPAFTSAGSFVYEVNALPINEVCRIAASATTITVVSPTLNISITGNQSRTLCRGDKLTLDALIKVSTSPSNANVTLNAKREWKDESGAAFNALTPYTFSKAGTYKFTVDVEATARYVSGGSCGTIEADKTQRSTVTIVVDSCQPSLQSSATNVCEGSWVNLQISKSRLKFTWDKVKFSPAITAENVLEDNDKITFSVQALNNPTVVRISSISASYAESGDAAAVTAPPPVSITAQECLPSADCNTKACPGKNFTIGVNGNTNVIDSIRVTKATNLLLQDNNELTEALAITKKPGANATAYSFIVTPGDTTLYTIMVHYKVGAAQRSKLLTVQVNPYSPLYASCRPRFRYGPTDSTCVGFEQVVNIDNKGYTIKNVTWKQTCGDANPVAAAANNLQWKFMPLTSCDYIGVIEYTAGAQTLTSSDTFKVKVRSCKPRLQVDTCPDDTPDCTFKPDNGNGGEDGNLTQNLCQGQKIRFYINHFMGANRIPDSTDIVWTPNIAREFVVKTQDGNADSISVYAVQPTATATYTAVMSFENTVTHQVGTTTQSYTTDVAPCVPPVYPQAVWNGEEGRLCRGNELRFIIPKTYKNNRVTSVAASSGLEDISQGTDTITYRALPKAYGELDYKFTISFNTSVPGDDVAAPRSHTITIDSCSPTIFAPGNSCEGVFVSIAMRKNNLVFSKDSVTFSGSENTFRPKHSGSDNAAQIGYRIMAHSYPNNLSASVRLQNGEQQQLEFSVDGKLCEPYFTAPTNEICPKTNFNIGVAKTGSYTLDSVLWQDKGLVKNTVDRYTGNLSYSNTFRGSIFYSYGDGTDTVRTWTEKEAPVKIFRQVFVCDDTTICRGSLVNLNSIIKTNVAIPAYIDTLKSPYFTDTFFIPARVADCTNPQNAVTVEESLVIVVDSAIWVASMMDTVMCLGDSITLNATGLGRFSWFSTDSSELYGSPRPRVSPKSTTRYVATVKNACGPKFDTALVTVKTPPNKPIPIYGVQAPLAHNYYTYFIEANPSVDKYEWAYPPDWELNSVGGDSIKFRFSETPGDLAITAYNVCGNATDDKKIDVRNGYDIVVYPNPVSDLLYLKARSCRMERIVVYSTSMVAMLPIVVFNNPQNEFTINVEGLAPNPYFLFVWVDQQKKPLVYKFAKYDDKR